MRQLRVPVTLAIRIANSEFMYVTTLATDHFVLGELIEVRGYAAEPGQPTGLMCHRYVCSTECTGAMDDGEGFFYICLGTFDFARRRLGLSRVRKSDNLESF
jgi:hypothetical protein